MGAAIACAAMFAAAVGGGSAGAQVLIKEGQFEPIKGLEVVEKLGQKIPLDLEFTDADGKKVKLAQYFNQDHKPVVLALVYFRCPMQCPTIMNKMVQRFNGVDWKIGEKYNVITVSFDPSETVADADRQRTVLHTSYIPKVDPQTLEAGWPVLTSNDPMAARKLADAVGFPYKYLPESNEYSHGTVIFVLTPDGTISRYLYGVDYPSDQLRMALLEASDGKIGSTMDRIIFFCFHYDPSTGKYTVAVVRLMRVGGIFSMAFVGVVLARMLMVERKRRALRAESGSVSVG
jgi:protein SCO1/2